MYLIIVVYLKHKKHWKPNFEKKKKPKKQKQPSPKTNKKTKKGFRMGNRHFPKDINGQMGFLKMFHF